MATKDQYKAVFLEALEGSDYDTHYLKEKYKGAEYTAEVDRIFKNEHSEYKMEYEDDADLDGFKDWVDDSLFEYREQFVPRESHWDYDEDDEEF